MKALLLLPLASRAATAPAALPQVRWFSSKMDETVAMARAHRGALTGVIPCCSGPGVDLNGSFAGWDGVCAAGTGASLGQDEWVRQMKHLGLTVDIMSSVTPVALVNGTADDAIPGRV